MTLLCVSRPSNQHPVRLILHPITFRHLAFKGASTVFIFAYQLSSSAVMMSNYESDALSSPTHLPNAGPRPHSSTPTRGSLRLASCHLPPSPTSQLQEAGICPGSDLDTSQLAQLDALLPRPGSPSPPPSPLPVSSRKRLRKSAHPPAKRRRGRSTSFSVPAATPGPPSTVAGPS
ncbi:hypothetical protein XENORESO_015122, partial [Xenotaenia resolanae]